MVKLCNFPVNESTILQYYCNKNEHCCDYGCCASSTYHIYKAWCYWFIFLILFGLLYGISWFCRKPTRVQRSRSRDNNCGTNGLTLVTCTSPNYHYVIAHNPQSEIPYNRSDIVERLFKNMRINNVGDPPSYSSIKPPDYNSLPPPKGVILNSLYGPPPQYSTVTLRAVLSSHTRDLRSNQNADSAGSSVENDQNSSHTCSCSDQQDAKTSVSRNSCDGEKGTNSTVKQICRIYENAPKLPSYRSATKLTDDLNNPSR